MAMNIRKVTDVPVPDGVTGKYLPDTLFFVSKNNFFEQYLTDSTGDNIRRLATPEDIYDGLPVYSDTPPALPCVEKFWFNTAELTLYVQYDDGNVADWVEAISSVQIPEFAGTGTADTMARSDHNHDELYVTVGNHEW